MNILITMLSVCELALVVPIILLAAECFAAYFPRRTATSNPQRKSVNILIPAHNESLLIATTLASIRTQLTPADRLIVVADNCTDDTAAIARQAGAEALERSDPSNRGKGFALAWGISEAGLHDDSIVIMLDADTQPAPGAITALADSLLATGRPQQAVYLMDPPPDATPQDRISAFAFCLKNQVRLLGAGRLGIPCHLTGSGMALTPAMLSGVHLASAAIVEDMQLGIDLSVKGLPPRLCPSALVRGGLPSGRKAKKSQRRRWEHGHLATMFQNVPPLLANGITKGRPNLILLALDLSIPPLALLATLCMGFFLLSAAIFIIFHVGRLAFLLGMINGTIFAAAGFLAWAGFARGLLPLATIGYIPQYVLAKIPLYLSAIVRREKAWVPTARS
jgi:cellulose synthase/poly-beta-1,6-N-acetylglucosamine synthase-like glycosyltransferase